MFAIFRKKKTYIVPTGVERDRVEAEEIAQYQKFQKNLAEKRTENPYEVDSLNNLDAHTPGSNIEFDPTERAYTCKKCYVVMLTTEGVAYHTNSIETAKKVREYIDKGLWKDNPWRPTIQGP